MLCLFVLRQITLGDSKGYLPNSCPGPTVPWMPRDSLNEIFHRYYVSAGYRQLRDFLSQGQYFTAYYLSVDFSGRISLCFLNFWGNKFSSILKNNTFCFFSIWTLSLDIHCPCSYWKKKTITPHLSSSLLFIPLQISNVSFTSLNTSLFQV